VAENRHQRPSSQYGVHDLFVQFGSCAFLISALASGNDFEIFTGRGA
jgi:hypothetical protein